MGEGRGGSLDHRIGGIVLKLKYSERLIEWGRPIGSLIGILLLCFYVAVLFGFGSLSYIFPFDTFLYK